MLPSRGLVGWQSCNVLLNTSDTVEVSAVVDDTSDTMILITANNETIDTVVLNTAIRTMHHIDSDADTIIDNSEIEDHSENTL